MAEMTPPKRPIKRSMNLVRLKPQKQNFERCDLNACFKGFFVGGVKNSGIALWNTVGPQIPDPEMTFSVTQKWGFCASLAQIFFVFFFLASIFQTNRMFKPVFCADFWCADFCAHFCAHFRCADFCAHFCADFWCADFCAQFCAHFCAHFPQIFLRRFGAWKIGVPESRKNAQKMRGKMRGIRMALLGGAPHSLSACSSRQYATQPPLGRHTQGEHVSVHRDIFGLNYMLAFAPRFFKNKNPRKMSSAKPQPVSCFQAAWEKWRKDDIAIYLISFLLTIKSSCLQLDACCLQLRGNKSIYLHRSSPLLEHGLDKRENRYCRYGFASFSKHFHIYRRGGWSQSFTLKIFFSCSLGAGGRYFSAPCNWAFLVTAVLRSCLFIMGASLFLQLKLICLHFQLFWRALGNASEDLNRF